MSLHQLPKVIHVSIPLTKFRLLSFQTHHTQNSSGTLKAHKLSKEQKPDPKIKEPFERIPRMFKLPIRKTQKTKNWAHTVKWVTTLSVGVGHLFLGF